MRGTLLLALVLPALVLAAADASLRREQGVGINFDPIATTEVLGGEQKPLILEETVGADTRLGHRVPDVDSLVQPVNAEHAAYSEPTSDPGNLNPNAAALTDDVPDQLHFEQYAKRLFRDQGPISVHNNAAAEMRAMAPGQTSLAVYAHTSDAAGHASSLVELLSNVEPQIQFSPNGQQLPLPGTDSQPGKPPLGATPSQTTPFEVSTKPMKHGSQLLSNTANSESGESSEHTCKFHWEEESQEESSHHKCKHKHHKHDSEKGDIGKTLVVIKIDPKTATAPSANAMNALGGESSSEASGAASAAQKSESASEESSEASGALKGGVKAAAKGAAKGASESSEGSASASGAIDPNVEKHAKAAMKKLIDEAGGGVNAESSAAAAEASAAAGSAESAAEESSLASNVVHVGDTDVKSLGGDVATSTVEAGGYRVVTESGTKATRTTVEKVPSASEGSEKSESADDPAAEAIKAAEKAARDAEKAAEAMDVAEKYAQEGMRYHKADIRALNPLSTPTPWIGKTIVHTVHKEGSTTAMVA